MLFSRPRCRRRRRMLSNIDGDGYENVNWKWSRVVSNFTAFIPSRSIRQKLTIGSGVEF